MEKKYRRWATTCAHGDHDDVVEIAGLTEAEVRELLRPVVKDAVDELVDFDDADLAHAVRDVVLAEVRPVIVREIQAALYAVTGKIDSLDDLTGRPRTWRR